jgi:hypothetical protein
MLDEARGDVWPLFQQMADGARQMMAAMAKGCGEELTPANMRS